MKDCISFFKLSLTVFAFSFSIFASTSVLAANGADKSGQQPWNSPDLGPEEISLRDRYSKHFYKSPTERKAMTFASPIHYKSGKQWLEISNEIESNHSGNYPNHPYLNDKNEFTSYYPKNPAVDGFVLDYKGNVLIEKVIGLKYLDASGNEIGKSNFTFMANRLESSNVIRYAEVLPGMDLVYSQNNTGKKMVVEVKNASALSVIPANTDRVVISEEITLPANSTSTLKDGNVEVRTNGILIATYIKPIADQGLATSSLDDESEGEVTVSQKGKTLEFDSEFDAAWITNTNRDFPILLDPTANYGPFNVSFATGYMTSATGGKSSGFLRLATNTTTAWGKFNISGLGTAGATSLNSVKYYGYHYTGTISPNKIAQIRDMNNTDPVSATNTAIRSQATTGTQYSNTLVWGVGSTYGWHNATLGSTANLDIWGRISRGWTALGFTYQSGSTSFSYHYGYNGTSGLICYLAIDYNIITSPNDAGVLSIAADGTCPGTAYDIKVRLKNHGTSPLTSASVNWTRDVGSGPVTQTPLSFGGTLAPGADTLLTVGTFTFATVNTTLALKAYSSLPNGVADTINTNDTASSSTTGSLSGSFTVGGTTPDFVNLRSALDSLKKYGVCSNVVLRVRPGTYTEQIVLNGGISGLGAGTWIDIMPDTTMTGSVNYQFSGDACAIAGNAEYVRFKNINIKTLATIYSAVYIYNVNHHITFDGCVLQGSTSPPSTTSNAYATVYKSSGVKNEYFEFLNCDIKDGSYGMYLNGGNASDLEAGLKIINNNITGWTYMGIYNYYSDEAIIRNNSITHSSNGYNYPYGIYSYYADFSEVSGNTMVLNNANNGGGWGMYWIVCDGSPTAPVKIFNNMISMTGSVNNTNSGALYASSGAYNKIFHNSFYTKNSSTSTSAEAVYLYPGTGSEFRNNAVFNDGVARVFNASSTPTRSNNNWYNIGTAAVGNLTPGTGSISADPIYANPSTGNLHSNSTAMDSAAMVISGYTMDIDGQARDTSNPDIGADEFDVVYKDAGVTAIADGQVFCPGSNGVMIKVKNFGLDTLTSVTLNWSASANSGSYVTQTPVSFTGISLATGQDTVLNAGNYSVASGSTYRFKAYTSSPNGLVDQAPGNDSLESGSFGVAVAAGTYTIGGTSPDYATIAAAMSALEGNGICGAVTMNIRQGTYNESVTFGRVEGASAGAWVTFQADPANTSAVDWTNSGVPATINGTSYLRLKGLHVTSTSNKVIELRGSNDHVTVIDNKLTGRNISSTSNFYSVIYDNSGSANQTHNLRIENNEILNGSYGIYLFGNGTGINAQDSVMIRNNDIKNWYRYGIYNYYSESTIVDSNDIASMSNAYTSGSCGMYLNYAYKPTVTNNNVLLTTSGYGAATYFRYCDGTFLNRGLIANNMFTSYSNSTVNTTTGVNYSYFNDYTDFVNNSYYGTFKGTSTTYGLMYYYRGTDGNFKNNSVYNDGAGRAMYANTATGSSHNNVKSTGSANFGGSGIGTNSLSLDPYYTDPSTGNLHAYGTSLDSAGTPFAAVTVDYDGESRNATNPDIGADEYDFVYYDAGISAIDASVCATGDSISVTIKNTGFDTLKFVTVNWELSTNGGAYVTQTTLSWTGAIVNGQTALKKVTNQTFSTSNTYSVRAFTSSPNGNADQRTSNDTLIQSVDINANPVVTFTPSAVCVDSAVFALSGNPAGGTFTGTGVSSNNFNAAVAGVGTHSITYVYADSLGCANAASANQVVNALPTVSLSTLSNVCNNTPSFALSGGTPSGGVYSGTGVSSGNFDGNSAGTGTHLITYTYTDGNSCTNFDSTDITVDLKPTVAFSTISDQCANASAFSITGGTPASGVYSVNGITTNSFDPSASSAGNYAFKYKFTAQNSCSDSVTQSVAVLALPSITNVVKNNLSACGNTDGSITITASGGNGPLSYSIGSAFQSTGVFTSLGTGSYTPTVKDSAGCQVSDIIQTVASPSAPPAPMVNNVDTYCFGATVLAMSAVKQTGATVKWYSDVNLSTLLATGDNYTPATTVGVHNYYAAQTVAGCESPGTLAAIKINPLPTVTFSSLTPVCTNTPTFNVTGGAPNGGAYTGTGVSSGAFNSGISGSGNHVVTYTFTDLEGCVNSDTSVQVVNTVTAASISALSARCIDAGVQSLSIGSPSGGMYYGNGVANGNFNPIAAGSGTHTIKYVYTNTAGCEDSANTNVRVDSLPVATMTSLTSICVNTPSFTLTQGSATPSGGTGTYFGQGVTSGTTFDASTLSFPGNYSISYAYTDGNGCKDTASTSITVNAKPSMSFFAFGNRCEDAAPITLNSATPVGGTYSGPGVTGTSFNPTTAGPGTHRIKYTYTNTNSCTDSVFRNTRVDSLPIASFSAMSNVCANTPAFSLTNGSASPSTGFGSYFGNGVSGNGSFNASVAGTGSTTLYYAYTDGNNCKDTASTTVFVDTVPTVTTTALGPWCAYDTNTVLVGGMPLGGKFTGANVDTSGRFNPSMVAAGSHNVSYSYTDGNNCTDSSAQTITVNGLPNVIMSLQRKICLNADSLTLNGGSPKGSTGVYSGNNVYNGGIYKPSALTVDTITYTFTDGNGCVNSNTKVLRVDSVPVVAMGSLPHFCEGATAMTLTQGSPMGGVYTGGLVSGTMFNPTTAGSYTVTYTYTDGNGCSDSVGTPAVVDTVPNVSVGVVANSCSNTPAFGLTGTPASGTFSGPGVSGVNFDPSTAGSGNHTIQYLFVDGNGCKDSVTTSATVRQSPTVTVSALAAMCVNDDPYTLVEGRPIGVGSATWKGPGVNMGVFTPDASITGSNTIWYVYTGTNGCSDSTSQVLVLDANPSFNLGADLTSCGSDIKTLDAGISNVTYQWSNGEKTKTVLANKSGQWTCYVVDTATMAKCTFTDTVNVNYEAVCVGIDEDLADRVNVRYYPNPTSGRFTAEIEGFEGKQVDMMILNMQGQVVYDLTLEEMPVMFKGEIDMSNEPSGMYFIHLISEGKSVQHRISLNR